MACWRRTWLKVLVALALMLGSGNARGPVLRRHCNMAKCALMYQQQPQTACDAHCAPSARPSCSTPSTTRAFIARAVAQWDGCCFSLAKDCALAQIVRSQRGLDAAPPYLASSANVGSERACWQACLGDPDCRHGTYLPPQDLTISAQAHSHSCLLSTGFARCDQGQLLPPRSCGGTRMGESFLKQPLVRHFNPSMACSPGSFWPPNVLPGTTCLECPTGQVSATVNAERCHPCPAGKYASGPALCVACPRGKFSPSMGRVSCHVCPSGQYEDRLGSTDCRICSAGKRYNPLKDASAAYNPLGWCSRCPFGQFGKGGTGATCHRCPMGSMSASMHRIACTKCEQGRYQTSTSRCNFCPRGKFGAHRGKAYCMPCPAGKWSGLAGEVCLPCASGRWGRSGARSGSCSGACLPGRYGGEWQTTDRCSGSCAPGHFGLAGSKMPACSGTCTRGQYAAAAEGATKCIACPKGKYQPDEAQTACDACPKGERPDQPVGAFTCLTTVKRERAELTAMHEKQVKALALQRARATVAAKKQRVDEAQDAFARAKGDMRTISASGVDSAFKRTPAQKAHDLVTATAVLVRAAEARAKAAEVLLSASETVQRLDTDPDRIDINANSVKQAKEAALHAETANRVWWQQLDLDRKRAKAALHQEVHSGSGAADWLAHCLEKTMQSNMPVVAQQDVQARCVQRLKRFHPAKIGVKVAYKAEAEAAAYALPRTERWAAARRAAHSGLALCTNQPRQRGSCSAAVLRKFVRDRGDMNDFAAEMQAWNRQWGQDPCPPGWQHSSTAPHCSPCPPGAHVRGTTCEHCRAGSFSNHTAASKCTRCDGRSAAAARGATACTACGAGRAPNTAHAACVDVPGVLAQWRRLSQLRRVGSLAAVVLASVALLAAVAKTAVNYQARRTAFAKDGFWQPVDAAPTPPAISIVASVGAPLRDMGAHAYQRQDDEQERVLPPEGESDSSG